MRFFSLVFAFYFLSGSLMPRGHWDELPGMVNLAGHYQEHQERTPGNTFSIMHFLALHYDATSGHQQQEDHSKLPFNHPCTMLMHMAVHLLPNYAFNSGESRIEKVFSLSVYIPRIHIADLLQPPRA